MLFRTVRILATLLLVAGPATASAQADWPAAKPVTLVVPSSPGGGTDAYGRILAQALTEQLKQSFVVDNKPGASGAIGAMAVAKAEPNGYTILVASNSSLGINPVLMKNLSYDVQRDFAPVTRGVMAPMVVVAHPDTKVKTLAELLDRGRKMPGKLFYGSAGVGSPLYIGTRMIAVAGNADFGHVPYKGAGAAYTDLLAGRLHFMLTDLASVRQHLDSGKLVALAVTEKTPLLPGTPTLAEAGLPNIKAFTSFSVLVPAKTPPALVARIGAEVAKAMRSQATAAKLAEQALLPVFDTPEQFSASLREEQRNWGDFIRAHNIVAE